MTRQRTSGGAGIRIAVVVTALAAVALLARPASAAREAAPPVSIEWVTVGQPGNPADTEVMAADRTTGYGSVPYTYRIGKYEVTNAQYAAFLNAVARESDPYLLYHPNMDRAQGWGFGGGLVRTGEPGNWSYQPAPGREDRPVNYYNMFDGMRFANWLHNGQGDGETETGAYTLKGGTAIPSNAANIRRNPGAKVFIPNEDEWYKAAYYDPKTRSYWNSPARSDEPLVCGEAGATPNTGSCAKMSKGEYSHVAWEAAGMNPYMDVMPAGSYTASVGPWGTFDQGGNVMERLEGYSYDLLGVYQTGGRAPGVVDGAYDAVGSPFVDGVGPLSVLRGGDFWDPGLYANADGRVAESWATEFENYGFRLASPAR